MQSLCHSPRGPLRRILAYSDAAAMRELERARVGGDIEAGMKQLLACMGEARPPCVYNCVCKRALMMSLTQHPTLTAPVQAAVNACQASCSKSIVWPVSPVGCFCHLTTPCAGRIHGQRPLDCDRCCSLGLHAGNDMQRVDFAVHLLCEFTVSFPLAFSPPPPANVGSTHYTSPHMLPRSQLSDAAGAAAVGSSSRRASPERRHPATSIGSSGAPNGGLVPPPADLPSTSHLLFCRLLLVKLHAKLCEHLACLQQQQPADADAAAAAASATASPQAAAAPTLQGRGCSNRGYLLQDALFSWMDSREDVAFPIAQAAAFCGGSARHSGPQFRAAQKQQCRRCVGPVGKGPGGDTEAP